MKRTEICDAIAVICLFLGFAVLSVAFVLMICHVTNSNVLWISGACMYFVGMAYVLFSEEGDSNVQR